MIAKSALKHCKLNQAILNLAILEFRASDTLERGTMFVEIVEGLVLRPKRLSSWHTCRTEPIASTKVMICPLSDSVFGTIRTLLSM